MNYSDAAEEILSRMSDVEIKVNFCTLLECYLEYNEVLEEEGISGHERDQAYHWLGHDVKFWCDMWKGDSEE